MDTPERLVPLDEYVEKIKAAKGRDDIPYFSRHDGGVEARMLLVLQDPGETALKSGFASVENDDPTSRGVEQALKYAEIGRALTASWNVIAWKADDPKREVEEGVEWLWPLVGMMRRLRVVVLMGAHARKALPGFYEKYPDLEVVLCPHPSRPVWRPTVNTAVAKAARRLR